MSRRVSDTDAIGCSLALASVSILAEDDEELGDGVEELGFSIFDILPRYVP